MTAPDVRRRTVLGTVGSGALALTGGCLRRVRSLAGWESGQQVQLRIKTVPDDADPYALQLARAVAGWFREAGIDARVVPVSEQELYRQTLLGDEFGLFVARLPARYRDPDALYTLLHSRFAADPGWQNPFGYANLDVDDRLETQRRTEGSRRREVLEALQVTVARTQPFTLLTVPEDIRAVRTTNYTNWRAGTLDSPLGYLLLDRAPGGNGRLRVAATDGRATRNLNPLSVEFRRTSALTGLLYDPLGYAFEERLAPWLAEAWEFSTDGAGEGGETPVARVTLREGATWHDGTPLTADDVAFTYRLLADTTLGSAAREEADPFPSPRYRGRSSLVAGVDILDDATVEVRFADVSASVARRAFTVPVLPKHVWKDRTEPASLAGVNVGPVTEALVTSNIPPVGSGPLRFHRNTPGAELVLERFDDHFLHREGAPTAGLPARVGGVAFETLSVRTVGSDVTAAEVVADDAADATGTPVGADVIPRIGRRSGSELLVQRSDSPYVLGYNTRVRHLGNPRFRHTLARLIDAEHLAESVVDGYSRPAVGPLYNTEWYPSELRWTDGNPVAAFLGSDGDLDRRRVRDAMSEAGYRYEGDMLVGGEP